MVWNWMGGGCVLISPSPSVLTHPPLASTWGGQHDPVMMRGEEEIATRGETVMTVTVTMMIGTMEEEAEAMVSHLFNLFILTRL